MSGTCHDCGHDLCACDTFQHIERHGVTFPPLETLAYELYKVCLRAYHQGPDAVSRDDWRSLGEAAQAIYRPVLEARK